MRNGRQGVYTLALFRRTLRPMLYALLLLIAILLITYFGGRWLLAEREWTRSGAHRRITAHDTG